MDALAAHFADRPECRDIVESLDWASDSFLFRTRGTGREPAVNPGLDPLVARD
jgi:hypothetical protein